MKGIILAGGQGSRLFPSTRVVCKQLLPIYDKPLIYYPLSVLMLAGIRDILLIGTPHDLPHFQDLFGTGAHLGLSIRYAVQTSPRGIADAFLVGRDFIGHEPVCLILGDNVFYGDSLRTIVREAASLKKGAQIFAYPVNDPRRYGVVTFDENHRVTSLEEKPLHPKSRHAVPGLYFYDAQAVNYAEQLKPSSRGELEITDLNRLYMQDAALNVSVIGRGWAWLDTGTPESMQEASQFIQIIEKRQGLKIACIEEIAYREKYIALNDLCKLIEKCPACDYRDYLQQIVVEDKQHACIA